MATTGYHFFLKWAGWSYDPKKETKIQGRQRCARELAHAERKAYDKGLTFHWAIDVGYLSSEWIDDDEDGGKNHDPWLTWFCVAKNKRGTVVASLSGIDFGRDGEPWGDPYRRVVEAELASEAFARVK